MLVPIPLRFKDGGTVKYQAVLYSITRNAGATPEIGMELDKAGNYGPDSGQKEGEGSVTISAAGVMLQHANISGNLLISEAVGDGDVKCSW